MRLLPFVAVFASACLPRVVLPPPPPTTASVEERTRFLKELEPLSVVTSPPAWLAGAQPNQAYIMLKNGQRVTHPDDLLPLVPLNSPTASYARDAEAGMTKASWAMGVSVAMLLAGAVTMTGSILSNSPLTSAGRGDVTGVLVGGAIDLGAFVPLILGLVWGSQASLDRQSAFVTYPRDLRRTLGLDAEPAAPTSAPPPAAPAP